MAAQDKLTSIKTNYFGCVLIGSPFILIYPKATLQRNKCVCVYKTLGQRKTERKKEQP